MRKGTVIVEPGTKFGRYTVIKETERRISLKNKKGRRRLLCKCQCGTVKDVDYDSLKRGVINSCGCYHKEVSSIRKPLVKLGERFNSLVVIHEVDDYIRESGVKVRRVLCKCDCGKESIVRISSLKAGEIRTCGDCPRISKMPEFAIWAHIKQRCLNKKHHAYKSYGGRGITVCDRWQKSFKNFLEDMGQRPSKEHSIERSDNDGHYEPSNCVWATRKQQMNNRRCCKKLELNGKILTQKQWADKLGVSQTAIYTRLKGGMSVEQALTKPFIPMKRKPIEGRL
jgi:hypothetical protein